MTAARSDLRDLPDWPRLLSREQAAAYLGVSVTMLESRIGDPFPAPIRMGGRKLYDRRALDKAVDSLSGVHPQSAADEVRRGLEHAGRQVASRQAL